jgi:nucleotide-binding universal stress UspA family protein
MYKAIVVGTDGSERAAIAVNHALRLAKMSGAVLHIVHAVRPVIASVMGSEYVDPAAITMTRSAMHDEGEQICARMNADAEREGLSAEVHNLEGDPADVLIRVAESVNADVVVVGNRGMSGIKRFALGSVPNKVAHHSPCSVLIVDTDRT